MHGKSITADVFAGYLTIAVTPAAAHHHDTLPTASAIRLDHEIRVRLQQLVQAARLGLRLHDRVQLGYADARTFSQQLGVQLVVDQRIEPTRITNGRFRLTLVHPQDSRSPQTAPRSEHHHAPCGMARKRLSSTSL